MTGSNLENGNQNINRQFIVFTMNNQYFAIDIIHSREILSLDEVTNIPESPEFVKGVINLRGEIVPIIDLANKVNEKKDSSVNKLNKIITVKIAGSLIGIEVNQVKEIIRLSDDDIRDAPEIVQDINTSYIEGIAKVKGELVLLLDIDSILSARDFNLLNEFDKNQVVKEDNIKCSRV